MRALKGARAKAVNGRKKHAGKYSLFCLDEGMKKWLLRRNLKVLQNFSDINKDDRTGSNEISLSEE